jgi:hypothetical protein
LFHPQKPANAESENTAAPSANASAQTSTGTIAGARFVAPLSMADARWVVGRRNDPTGIKALSF